MNSESKLATSNTDSWKQARKTSELMHVHEGTSTYDAGLERRLNLLRQQPVPIDISSEERMSLDLVSAMIAQPPLRIPLQQSGHDAPRFRGDVGREVERIGEDPLVHDVHILIVERRQSGHHLIDQYTESPPVDSLRVPLTFEELRGDVFWCTTKGCGRTARLASNDKSLAREKDLSLVAFSVSDIFSLHSPKSQSAMCPV